MNGLSTVYTDKGRTFTGRLQSYKYTTVDLL